MDLAALLVVAPCRGLVLAVGLLRNIFRMRAHQPTHVALAGRAEGGGRSVSLVTLSQVETGGAFILI
jgi:hypothetical protein